MARLKAGEKARNVACLVWLEDLERIDPERPYGALLSFLDGLHVMCAVSPVHDKDVYTSEDVRKWVDKRIDPDYYQFISEDLEKVRELAPRVGDRKKPHVHVLLKFDGPKSRESLSELMAPFVSISPTKWEKVEKFGSYLRYLAHLDTPEKHQYSALDVKGFGGLDMSELVKQSSMSNIVLLCKINEVIKQEGFKYFHELDAWAYSTGDMDTIRMVTGRASYYSARFRSRLDELAAKKAAEKKND